MPPTDVGGTEAGSEGTGAHKARGRKQSQQFQFRKRSLSRCHPAIHDPSVLNSLPRVPGWGVGDISEIPLAHGGPCSFHPAAAEQEASFTSLLPSELHSPELRFRSAGCASVFDLESRAGSFSRMGSMRAPASAQLPAQHFPPRSVDTASKCKTDEPCKEKSYLCCGIFWSKQKLEEVCHLGHKTNVPRVFLH